ncbi:MAG: geranylgeranylglycerol-phosphate geranylgeranyltransferase [Bacteroidia bacterium]|nr:geranylgeranylglycerol-phosphate geranylgeranyltransferase [Bacteroidia bacterium]MBT8310560.1 geranylgeranylglycerol-phosphate geranylgeranyltransferase [Bacteroidia bacterium]NND10172.1 geranylgeranylglycerol-phosphate geranylgeranyltransferase [Flavobacteriaceae bacterium]NNK26925.1 geranylgeranylglycerol-phosphate geranylgeranyltransferase [Flavobacteriaceae bacterium]NNL61015.1 geranylgeranylglycerol-phosphate geranylgeranyltransferase [Flavobacteriaceae bacterium]
MNILNLIRWKNLIMIIAIQLLLKYALFHPFGIDITLNAFGFGLLVLATICIAAAGYIINDIYDLEADTINKPDKVIINKNISEKSAFNWFIGLNIIGVGIGFYLSNLVGRSGFTILFIGISILLYLYASSLKHMLIIKNIIVALLISLCIIIVGLFELLPAITRINQETQLTIFKIVLDYALFAFVINLIREIVKDIQDMDGDQKVGLKTLAVTFGKKRAKHVGFALLILFIVGVSYYVITFLYKQQTAVGYFLLFVIAPLIYASIKLFTADSLKEIEHVSSILKLAMIFGMLSLLLYPFILK